MTTTLAAAISLDIVMSFEINPGSLLQFLESRAEGGPRLKCFEGSVTLVSPGMSHETAVGRLTSLILALCLELHIRHKALASTTWTLPLGAGDTAYEADAAYYIQSYDNIAEADPSGPCDRGCRVPPGQQGTSSLRGAGDPGALGARLATA